MPRITFGKDDEMKEWVKSFAKTRSGDPRYSAYVTERQEVILEPRTSTDPIRYGYIRFQTEEKLNDMCAYLRESNIPVFTCASYEFDASKGLSYSAQQTR